MKTIIAALLLFVSFANSAQVTIGWDRSDETNVLGYRLYYEESPTNGYLHFISLPVFTTEFTFTNLTQERLYYYAVSAVSTEGIEGQPSPWLAYLVPPKLVGPTSQVLSNSITQGVYVWWPGISGAQKYTVKWGPSSKTYTNQVDAPSNRYTIPMFTGTFAFCVSMTTTNGEVVDGAERIVSFPKTGSMPFVVFRPL